MSNKAICPRCSLDNTIGTSQGGFYCYECEEPWQPVLLMSNRASEQFRFNKARPEQIRVYDILANFGLNVGEMDKSYEVWDDLNQRTAHYEADIPIMVNKNRMVAIVEIQGASHDSEKGMLKTKRKRELSEKAGYIFIEIDAEQAKEYPEKRLIKMILRQMLAKVKD